MEKKCSCCCRVVKVTVEYTLCCIVVMHNKRVDSGEIKGLELQWAECGDEPEKLEFESKTLCLDCSSTTISSDSACSFNFSYTTASLDDDEATALLAFE